MSPVNQDPSGKTGRDLPEQALDCLSRGGAIITANDRASRALHKIYANQQRATGRLAWQTPSIQSWDSWLSCLWRQHLLSGENAPVLLTDLQERSIWKRIVEADAVNPGGDFEAIAKLASEAWKLLSDFEAHAQRRQSWSGYATADAEAFRKWASSFERECHAQQWKSRSDLSALLAESIQRKQIVLPPAVVLIGFDRVTPAQETLIRVLQGAGCAVERVEPSALAANTQLIEAGDPANEITTCAWWARRVLEAEPSASIAIVAQNVEQSRGELDRVFRQVLMPQSNGIENTDRMPFEFTLGQPLSSVPIIKAALLLLRWLTQPISQEERSWLILSGFIGAFGPDNPEIAALDAEMRQYSKLPPETTLSNFAAYRSRSASVTVRELLGILRQIERTAADAAIAQRRKTIADWLDLADRLLHQANWPGARSLDTIEYQALRRWDRFTGDIAALGFDDRRCGFIEFVTMLARYSAETIFSPESHDAQIQIIGAFESSGQTFDAIWFLGVDDDQWPPTAQPHPLLPHALQRRIGMPHSTIENDWQIALSATRRIAASAPGCVFSYSKRNPSGDLRPSALLNEVLGKLLAFTPASDLLSKLHVPEPPPQEDRTVMVEDTSTVAWPRELVAGGAEILKMQSACPFQAFAVRRLGAEELDNPERGLNAIDRGNILHKVLEYLWSKDNPATPPLRTRDDLSNAKVNGYLPTILDHHIDKAFERHAGNSNPSEWTREYHRVEKQRLCKLLLQWLDYEIERPSFTVEDREKIAKPQINGLQLNLRVDRIDRIEGGQAIIDYKTGSVSTASWRGERPNEPQLPLYAVHGDIPELKAVIFAQIRAGDLRFRGHVEQATVTVTNNRTHQNSFLKRLLDDELYGEWSDALSNLADRFLAGDASVTPREYPKTCEYCALPSLCRVAETGIATEWQNDEDDTGEQELSDFGGNADD